MMKEQGFFGPKGVDIRELSSGTLVFFNTDVVTGKTIDIMCKGIDVGEFDQTGHGLLSVIFRTDGRPTLDDGNKCQWMFFPDTYSAVCNVEHLLDRVIEISQGESSKEAKFVSFRSEAWKSILAGFFHELHHASAFLENPDLLRESEDAKDEEEDRADDFARTMLFTLAKEYDIEPSFTGEMDDIIDKRWADEIELAQTDDDEELQEWAKIQNYMRENGLFMHIPEEDNDDFNITNFKDLLHCMSGDDENDEEWLKNTNGISSTIPGSVNVTEVTMEQPMPQDSAYTINTAPQEPMDEIPWDTDEVPGMQGVAEIYNHTTTPTTPAVAPPTAPATQTPTAPPMAPSMESAPTTNPAAIVGESMYQPPKMSNEAFQAAIKGLYLKIYEHIFNGCGYNPGVNPFFTQGARIAEQLPLTEAERQIVKEMVCYNNQGQRTPGTKATNWVSGVFIDKAMTLPGFDLTLTDPNGTQVSRKFIPQNPNKTKQDGSLSMTAQWAREGHKILWIINPDNKDKQYAMRVMDGEVQSNISGQWAAV